MPTAAKTNAIANLSPAEKTDKIKTQQQKITRLEGQIDQVVADSNKKINQFVKTELPQIATYAGAGAAIGGLVAYWLFDQMRTWFGTDSYVGLLGTAAVGAIVIVAAPSLIKVTRKSIDTNGANQAALYGFGVGLVAVGAYRAYQEWPAA